MFIRVDVTSAPPALSLEEPETFDRFAVVVRGGDDPAAVDAALTRVGQKAAGDHMFVDRAALIALAKGSVADLTEWEAKLDAMVQYARSKGWTDQDGRVRAHIERQD